MDNKSVVRKMYDGLANLMTGGGTSIDRRKGGRWLLNVTTDIEVENAYRGNWLIRKIVDLPAWDMTREWRTWQGEQESVDKLEDEEERLCIKEKVRQAIILGRLGGGAIIMGTGEPLEIELDPLKIGVGDLKYLFVVPKTQLKPGPLITDPEDDDFGEPETFTLSMPGNPGIEVHESRVLAFKGLFTGGLTSLSQGGFHYWGDSVVANINEAVQNATTVQNEFATLIQQAKIDVFKIPKLMQNMGSSDYEQRFLRRLELANLGKSNHRALIMDADEEWDQRQLSLSGWAELIRTYVAIVAGAADIPATRLLGKSPDGMNATGDSDQANYEQMIRTQQTNYLQPLLEKLDNVLIPSALGQQTNVANGDEVDEDEDIYAEFNPLSVLGEEDAANVETKEAQGLKFLFDTGMFQDVALEEAYSQRMINSGRWPGYKEAREKALKNPEPQPSPRDITGVETPEAPGNPAKVTIEVKGAGSSGGGGGFGGGGNSSS